MYEKSYLSDSACTTASEASAQIEQSAVGAAEMAMSEARDLAYRAMQLVDRIVGSVPEQGSVSPAPPEPDGVFPILRRSSDRTVDAIRGAQSALNRLERSLP